MQSTSEVVKGWLDTFSPVETLAQNPAALAKEFETIVNVFARENAYPEMIDKAFQRIKITTQSRAWPTAAQVHEAMTYIRRERDGEAPVGLSYGDRHKLAGHELAALDSVILPGARRWLREMPGLRHHAVSTLQYWREPIVDDRGKDWTPRAKAE